MSDEVRVFTKMITNCCMWQTAQLMLNTVLLMYYLLHTRSTFNLHQVKVTNSTNTAF